MKLTLIALLILIIPFATLNAQVEYESRVEIELDDDFISENVLEFGEYGLLLRSQRKEKIQGQEEWRFQKYNTAIEQMEVRDFSVDKKYFLDESRSTEDRHFVLYQDKVDRYILMNIDIMTMELSTVEGQLPKKSRINDMVIMGDFAYFKTYIKKEPALFTLNWKTGDENIIPIMIDGYKKKELSLQNIQVLEEANEVLVYIIAADSKKESDLYVLNLDEKGGKKGISNLTHNIEENISDISSHKLNENAYVHTGTYSDSRVYLSQGLFFSKSTNNQVDFIEFYNFLDLDEFLSYLSERKENKIEKKKERKAAKGKELTLNYRIADHELIQLEDGYLFIGEAYYPTYRQENYTTQSVINGVSTPQIRYRRVFDGYQYTHAVIAKFSKEGIILWDRTFDLYQANKPFKVKRFIKVSEYDTNGFKLVYSSDYRLYSKYINYEGDILEDEESEQIETGYEGDKTKWSFSNLSYWYEDYFLVYGRQKIKNKEDQSIQRKRKVLFINKVKY